MQPNATPPVNIPLPITEDQPKARAMRTLLVVLLLLAAALALGAASSPLRQRGRAALLTRGAESLQSAVRKATLQVTRLRRELTRTRGEVTCLQRQLLELGRQPACGGAGGNIRGGGDAGLQGNVTGSASDLLESVEVRPRHVTRNHLNEVVKISKARQAGKWRNKTFFKLRKGVSALARLDVETRRMVVEKKARLTATMLRIRDKLYADSAVSGIYRGRWQGDDPCLWKGITCSRSGRIANMEMVAPRVLPEELGDVVSVRHLRLTPGPLPLEALLPAIARLPFLHSLTLEGTGVPELPESLAGARRLATIDVFKEPNLRRLPDGLFDVPTLRRVMLRESAVEALPRAGRFESLSQVKIMNCPIHSIQSLSTASNLTFISIEGAPIPELPARPHWPKLTKLQLMACENMRRVPDGLFALTPSLEDLTLVAELEELPEDIGLLTGLRRVEIIHNTPLQHLPKSVGNWVNAHEISIIGNNIRRLPRELRGWSSAQKIILDANLLDYIDPDILPGWTQVRDLSLHRNVLTSLPDTLGNMTRLQTLAVSGNRLTSLPRSLPPMLDTLRAYKNDLRSLPDEIGRLAHLRTLDLHKNPNLRSLGSGVGRLAALATLNVEDCGLTSLPENVDGMKQLSQVFLGKNALQTLPDAVGGWKVMEQIRLDNNDMRYLPNAIEKWTFVHLISMNGNPNFETLPKTLSQLPMLAELSVARCRLTNLPKLFTRKLERLYVSNNRIADLGELDLPSLRTLDVRKNLLTTIPDGLVASINLNVLRAGYNRLVYVPSKLFAMANLKEVMLSHNYLESSVFESLSPTISRFEITHNKLTRIPPPSSNDGNPLMNKMVMDSNPIHDITNLHKFTYMKWFSCAHCRIEHVPPELSKMKKLNVLRLSDNAITSFPDGFMESFGVYMTQGVITRSIFLDGNDVEGHDYSTVTLGSVDITLDFSSFFSRNSTRHSQRYAGDVALVTEEVRRMLGVPADADAPWRDGGVTVATGELTCSLRRMAYLTAQVTLRVCMCSMDMFTTVTGECRSCVDSAKCVDGSLDCVNGYLVGFEDDQPECLPCPAGGRCANNQVYPLPGYWKPEASNEVYFCGITSHACQGLWDGRGGDLPASALAQLDEGGSGSRDAAGCADGHHGPLCSICDNGRYLDTAGVCQMCPDRSFAGLQCIMMGGVFLAVVIVLTLLGDKSARAVLVKQSKGQADVGNSEDSFATGGAAGSEADVAQMLKVALSFIQTLVVSTSLYDVEWAGWLSNIDDWFGWLNFKFLSPQSFECVWERISKPSGVASVDDLAKQFSFYESFVLLVSVPALAVVASSLLWVGARGLILVLKPAAGVSKSFVNSFCIRLLFIVQIMMYLPVSSAVFQFFRCRSFDGGESYYLSADLAMECYSPTWYSYVPMAVAVIVVYSIGLPVVILCLLVPRALLPGAWTDRVPLYTTISSVVENFFGAYRSKYRWWEAVEMCRQLIITSVVIHLGSQASFQLTVSLLICFFALLLHLSTRPFKLPFLNHLQSIHLTLLYLTLSTGLMKILKVPSEMQSPIGTTILIADIMLVCAVVVNVVSIVVLQGWLRVAAPLLRKSGHQVKLPMFQEVKQ